MFDSAPSYVAVAFWLGLAAVICTWIAVASASRRRALDVIRAAIEHDKPLDPRIVRMLLGRSSRASQRRDLMIQACVWLALGVGFAIWAVIGFAQLHGVILGIGAILASIGGGLFAAMHYGFRDAQDDDE